MTNWGDIALALLPMVLLIGAWWFFMQRMRSPKFHNAYQVQCLGFMRRQTEALERIAAAAADRR
jgi:ATP-dependent Zn protease